MFSPACSPKWMISSNQFLMVSRPLAEHIVNLFLFCLCVLNLMRHPSESARCTKSFHGQIDLSRLKSLPSHGTKICNTLAAGRG
jgi:hypothetical protein